MNKQQPNNPSYSLAMKVSWQTIAVNLILSVGKLAAGIVGHSAAMVSDAVHSASDVFSTLIVMVGLKLSGREADSNHEYGHERLECVAAILLAVVLAATGIGIGYSGIESIRSPQELTIPGLAALWAAIISIAVKEGMYWYTRWAAQKCNSAALMADAWHHRSDALSSIGSLVGIAGARLGFPILDPVASLVICVFILKAALDIFRQAIEQLTDQAASPKLERQMQALILKQNGVRGLDLLKTRQFGSKIYVDVEFSADGDLTLREAHHIAQTVHDQIEAAFPTVKHCMVHVNPAEEQEEQN